MSQQALFDDGTEALRAKIEKLEGHVDTLKHELEMMRKSRDVWHGIAMQRQQRIDTLEGGHEQEKEYGEGGARKKGRAHT